MPIQIQSVDTIDDADIRIAVYPGVENLIGSATSYTHSNMIKHSDISVDSRACWYLDSQFCDTVVEPGVSIAIWGSSAFIVVFGIYYFTIRKRAFGLWLLLFVPFVACSTIPCYVCYDIGSLLLHEIGHAIGFSHPDKYDGIYVPCNETIIVTPASNTDSIMHSIQKTREKACITADDFNGVAALYGDVCSEQPSCNALDFLGMRMAIIAIWGVAVGCLIIAFNYVYMWIRKNRLQWV